MSQGSYVMPTSGIVSGATLAADMNAALAALASCSSGATAPTNGAGAAAVEGQFWLDTSTPMPTLRQDTGSGWAPVAVLDTVNNVWLPATGPIPTTTGTGAAYVAALTGYAPAALYNGFRLSVVIHVANTGPCTLKVGAVAAAPLRSAAGVDLPTGAVVGSSVYDMTYIGGEFILDGFFAGSSPVPPGVSSEYAGFTAPAGYLMEYGQAVSRTTYAPLMAAITIAQTGTLSNGSANITAIPSTANMAPGQPIESAHLPAGTTIASIVSGTAITVSASATAGAGTEAITVFPWGNGDGSITFNIPNRSGYTAVGRDNMSGSAANVGQVSATITTNGTTAATVGSAVGLAIGMYVNAAGVPHNATITAIAGTAITLSSAATATASGVAARFSPVADAQIVGSTGGAMTRALATAEMPSHTHVSTVNDPGHTHAAQGNRVTGSGPYISDFGTAASESVLGIQAAYTGIAVSNASAGGGQAHLTYSPAMVMNFIIKT